MSTRNQNVTRYLTAVEAFWRLNVASSMTIKSEKSSAGSSPYDMIGGKALPDFANDFLGREVDDSLDFWPDGGGDFVGAVCCICKSTALFG